MAAMTSCPRCGIPLATAQLEEFSGMCPRCLARMAASAPDPVVEPEADSAPLRPGAMFRDLEVVEFLDRGAMGFVYKARHKLLDRDVALKVLAPTLASSPEFVRRFTREAKLLASLNDPNIVQVYEYGKEGGLLFLTMELVDGDNLQKIFDRPSPPNLVPFLEAIRAVARGLSTIHKLGLVHRDIKPANLLLPREGGAKITDFGIAIETDDTLRLTQTGMFLGTPHFASPEQILGKPLDGRSDLYSLGVILYRGVTGRLPFEASTVAALSVKHLQELPTPVHKLAPNVPARIGEILRKLLAKNPAGRFDSALALEKDLGAVMDAIVSGPETPRNPGRRPETSSPTERIPRLSGTPFGKYRLLREIGRGGRGVVYEALDTTLNRKVALKMALPKGSAESEEEERRFMVEAQIGAGLPKHPHIVGVYEAGDIDNRPYLAMELVSGESMARWRKSSGASIEQQAVVIRDVARALDHAHRHGVIHRDVKPQNVLVDSEGHPHVTDFGLARMATLSEEPTPTIPGKVWGTPHYMSPEQARGAAVDARADVYALGVLLYEALAGRTPFRGDTPSQVLAKVVHDPVPPLPEPRSGAPRSRLQWSLGSVAMKALSRPAAQRQPSAQAFADEIDWQLQAASRNRKYLLWGGVAAAIVVLGLCLLGILASERSEAPARGPASVPDAARSEAAQARAVQEATERVRREESERARQVQEEERRKHDRALQAAEEELLRTKRDASVAEERAREAEARSKVPESFVPRVPESKEKPAPPPSRPASPRSDPEVPVAFVPLPADPAPAPPARQAPSGDPKVLDDGSLHWEAEDFSGGANPVADVDYHDSTPGNRGRAYRPDQDVDIYNHADGSVYVGDLTAGEWLHYRFQGGGRYRVELRYGARQTAAVHVEIDGVDVSGTISLTPMRDSHSWQTLTAGDLRVWPGSHDVRLVVDSSFDMLDWIRFRKVVLLLPPDPPRLRAFESKVRDLFKSDYAQRSPADLAMLARKLLIEGMKDQDDPCAKYVLLSQAAELAAQAGDAGLGVEAIGELEKVFSVDGIALKGSLLTTASKLPKSAEQLKQVAEAYVVVIEQACDREDFESALLLTSRAEIVARNAQNSALLARIQARSQEIRSIKDEYARIKPALKTLEEKPDDPAANLTAGLYRCFSRGEWGRGLPMLAKGSDAGLASIAQTEIAGARTPNAQAALAAGWRDAGEKRSGQLRTRCLMRALTWYQRAQSGTTGLDRIKIEGQIDVLTKTVWGNQALPKGLLFWVEPGKDPADPFREIVASSKATNNGSTLSFDSGIKALSFAPQKGNIPASIDYAGSEAVKAIGKSGSIFLWLKADSVDPFQGLINRGGTGENVGDWALYLRGGKLMVWNNWPGGGKQMFSKGSVPSGKWVHVGVVWEDTRWSFYIDGAEDATQTATTFDLPTYRATKINIGSNPPGGHEAYLGLIGSAMVFNRPLSGQEVSSLYTSGRVRFR